MTNSLMPASSPPGKSMPSILTLSLAISFYCLLVDIDAKDCSGPIDLVILSVNTERCLTTRTQVDIVEQLSSKQCSEIPLSRRLTSRNLAICQFDFAHGFTLKNLSTAGTSVRVAIFLP